MTPRPRAAASAWILGAAAYLTAEALAAAFRPTYSYAHDYISDLGVPGQPLAALMNVAFAAQGCLFLLGAVLAAGRRHHRPLLAFAAANAVGNLLVATVHAGDGALHLVGAALAIVGGNAAAIAGASLHPGARCRLVSRLLGVAGLVSLAALVVQAWAGIEVLPAPVWERASVYPILAWQLFAATAMLRASLPARRQRA
ncbi:DUF998 domain-containing protein [Mycolicibacterium baixiangningiae]|uniref:DUF998 domain-containing protein n=1 Tax=Mycolicibacterium baixiangningiae TaxID=2761578 RepID=UPI0018D1A996|nr:DUF998 domain-containing protein [Mycolicibacterium baixiangningiae]